MKLTSIGFLLLAVAFAAGALERDRILPSSTRVASREATSRPLRFRPSGRTPMRRSPPRRPDRRRGPRAGPAAPVRRLPAPPPPARMTLAQQAEFDSWMVKTYLGCWKPAAQARRR